MSGEASSRSSSVASSTDAASSATLVFDFGTYYGAVHPDDAKLRHGKGRLEYHSGNVYDGMWDRGAAHGRGMKLYANGDAYEGDWAAGKRHGEGTYAYQAGHVYIGEYCNDACEGSGRLQTVQGDLYDGQWKNGRKHGKGLEVMRDGQRFAGTWLHGKKEGEGVWTPAGPNPAPVRARWEQDKCVERLDVAPAAPGVSADGQERGGPSAASIPGMQPPGMRSQGGGGMPRELTAPLENAEEAAAAMEQLGIDADTIGAMSRFNTIVGRSMGGVTQGMDAIETQLSALTNALEQLDGLAVDDDLLDVMVEEDAVRSAAEAAAGADGEMRGDGNDDE